jgi:hypothetical protein
MLAGSRVILAAGVPMEISRNCCRGEDARRVEGVLDASDGAVESGVVGVVLVGDEGHEGGVAAVGG